MEPATAPVFVLLKLTLFGLDISITSAVLVIWAASLIVFGLVFWAARRPSLVPGKVQNLIEALYDFFESQTKDLFEDETPRWLPFIFALFCFILVSNLLGMIPQVYPINANINVTATLAIMVFLIYHYAGIRSLGLWRYVKGLLPEGVPVFIWPLMLVLEIMSHLARPFSLAVRLFANMTAGQVVGLTILSLMFIFNNVWLAGLPLLGKITIGLFEVFIAFVQAYVFAYLAALYIGLAIQEKE